MKVSYLALLVSYFSLAAYGQQVDDDTAYLVSGTGNTGTGDRTIVPTTTYRSTSGQPPSSTLNGYPPQGSQGGGDQNNAPQSSRVGSNGDNHGGHNDDDSDSDDDDDDETISRSLSRTTTTQIPASTTRTGKAGGKAGDSESGGYITTTLTIAIPVPLNTDAYDPSESARITGQSGGALGIKARSLAVSLAVIGAVAGAALM